MNSCLSVVKSIQIHEQIAVLSQQMSEQEIRAAIEAAEPRTKPGNPLALAAVALSNKSQSRRLMRPARILRN